MSRYVRRPTWALSPPSTEACRYFVLQEKKAMGDSEERSLKKVSTARLIRCAKSSALRRRAKMVHKAALAIPNCCTANLVWSLGQSVCI